MIGILLITHGQIGQTLIETAADTLGGTLPIPIQALKPKKNHTPDELFQEAQKAVLKLNPGGGVLILTDIYGSTPSNIAQRLKALPQVRVIAGVNLPMLIRILNYPALSLDELCSKAVSGGRDGIIDCETGPSFGLEMVQVK